MKEVFLAAALTASSAPAWGSTPAPGSVDRKAILNAIRPAVEAALGPNVEFVVEEMQVGDGWAFVQAEPQRRGGGHIDRKRYFHADEWEHMDGLTVTAVLQYRYGHWNLVEKAIGATDAWQCGSRARFLLSYC